MLYKLGDILSPLLLQYLIMNITVLFLGPQMDAVLLTSISGIISLLVIYPIYLNDQKKLTHKPKRAAWWVYLLSAVFGIICNLGISSVMNLLNLTDHFSNTAQEGLLAGNLLVQIIGIGVIVPVMEEVLFRGLIYNRLKKYLPWKPAIFLAAAIFALYHGNIIQIIFAFPMGLILVFIYQKWKSLAVPIVFHIISNLFTIILNTIIQ